MKFGGNSTDLMKAEDDNNESMLALQRWVKFIVIIWKLS